MLHRPKGKPSTPKAEESLMRISQGVRRLAQLGLGALAATVLGMQVGAAQESLPAVWTAKELHFAYMGFTTHYSCEGLRDQVRDILLRLGARREDLKVRESGCTALGGRPDPFPAVDIKMHVLQPAPGAASEPLVAAHWKPVDLLAHQPGLDAAGQCELYEQVRQRILPLFTARNLNVETVCVPHQLILGARMKTEVLVADQPPPRS
jgi:hypothetical protein